MSESTIVPAESVTAQKLGHRVVLKWWTYTDDNDRSAESMEWHEIVLPVEDAESLLVALTTSCHNARRQQVEDAIAGDCPTCGNVRMVQELRYPENPDSKTWSVHCPDCFPRIQAFRNGTAPLPEVIPERYRDLA